MHPFGLVQTVAPTTEPITTLEAKTQATIGISDDDTFVDTLIARARADCERVSQRQLVTATWKLTLDRWPCDAVIRVPRPPLQSVTSITYVDYAGTRQTVSAAIYQVDLTGNLGRIRPVYGQIWPVARLELASIEVIFVAGYGAASAVPTDIKGVLKQAIAYCYQNREQADQELIDKLFLRFWTGGL